AATLRKLFADLGAGDFRARAKATAALADLGEAARGAVQAELDRAPSAEARARLQGLLDRMAAPSPGRLRFIRAVEAVGGMATPEAWELLEAWAGGAAGTTLAEEARVALGRRRR